MKTPPACGACKEVRVQREAAEKNKPTPGPARRRDLIALCATEGHKADEFGYCTRCEQKAEQ